MNTGTAIVLGAVVLLGGFYMLNSQQRQTVQYMPPPGATSGQSTSQEAQGWANVIIGAGSTIYGMGQDQGWWE